MLCCYVRCYVRNQGSEVVWYTVHETIQLLCADYIWCILFFFKKKRLQSPHPLFRKSSAIKRYGAEAMLSPSAQQVFLQDAHCMPCKIPTAEWQRRKNKLQRQNLLGTLVCFMYSGRIRPSTASNAWLTVSNFDVWRSCIHHWILLLQTSAGDICVFFFIKFIEL